MTAAAIGELDSPADVLGFVRGRRADADAAERDLLMGAATWAAMHSVDSLDGPVTAAHLWEIGVPLAGEGAPLVAEYSVAELAAALGRSTDSGRVYLAQAMELRHRLPRTWRSLVDGRLPAWRARRIADATLALSAEAAGFVDGHVASVAASISWAQLDRLIDEAVLRYDPEKARAERQRAAETRRFDVDTHQASFTGTVQVTGELDLADALDLEDAVSRGAAALGALGDQQPLDVRRSVAAGELARAQLSLDLTSDAAGADPGPAPSSSTARAPRPRDLVLYVHLHEAALGQVDPDRLDLARVENPRGFVLAEQVREWCRAPGATISVRPVLDLAEHLHTEAYEVPDRLREQSTLLHQTCVFPWCTRPARRCDRDHCTNWRTPADPSTNPDADPSAVHDHEGATCSHNIAPLCRRHHRHKTHTRWSYTRIDATTFLWTSPHGLTFLRDHRGTRDVSPPPPDV